MPDNNSAGSGQYRHQLASDYARTYNSFSGYDMVVIFEIPLFKGKSISEVVGSLQTLTYSIHEDKTPVRSIGNMNVRGYVFGPRTVAGTMIFTVFNKHWATSIMDKYLKVQDTVEHFLVDELPPLNVTISMANEYGQRARLALFGVTFVNEGQVMSINDSYTENTFEFYATDVDYLDDMNVNRSTPAMVYPPKEKRSALSAAPSAASQEEVVSANPDASQMFIDPAQSEVSKGVLSNIDTSSDAGKQKLVDTFNQLDSNYNSKVSAASDANSDKHSDESDMDKQRKSVDLHNKMLKYINNSTISSSMLDKIADTSTIKDALTKGVLL